MNTATDKPDQEFNFAQYLIALNLHRPQKVAFIDDDESLNYGDLADRISRTAGGLSQLGINPGERVLLILQDSNDFPVAFLGAIYAGIVPIPVNTLMTEQDYQYFIEDSGATAVFVSGSLLPVVESALDQATHNVKQVVVSKPKAPLTQGQLAIDSLSLGEHSAAQAAPSMTNGEAFWLYTSGSTGQPKGAVHRQDSLYWTAKLYGAGVLKVAENDVCFSAAKMFFAYGLGNSLAFALSVGATVILMAERATPAAVVQRWKSHRPSLFFGAPTGYAALLEHTELPPKKQLSLRLASSAGEALPEQLGKKIKDRLGIDVIDGIGSTEMLHIYLSNRPDRLRYGTTGWPVPGYEIKLLTENGEHVAESEIGDLYVKGPSAATHYWRKPDKTAATFKQDWVKTGDKYRRNSDASYTCMGRSDDMIKVSGIYVSPFEVEATLSTHPALLEAAVVGESDHQGLTKTKAYVVTRPGHTVTAAELKAFVKQRLAPYKYPRMIEFLAELPKTATGKIQRFKLRQ